MRIRSWHLSAIGFACLLLTSGCESMIEGVTEDLTHDSDVRNYERRGLSHKDAEEHVFEDNFFDHNP